MPEKPKQNALVRDDTSPQAHLMVLKRQIRKQFRHFITIMHIPSHTSPTRCGLQCIPPPSLSSILNFYEYRSVMILRKWMVGWKRETRGEVGQYQRAETEAHRRLPHQKLPPVTQELPSYEPFALAVLPSDVIRGSIREVQCCHKERVAMQDYKDIVRGGKQ